MKAAGKRGNNDGSEERTIYSLCCMCDIRHTKVHRKEEDVEQQRYPWRGRQIRT